MFTQMMLADVSNNSLLLGFIPESFGLLILGLVLIACAASLRWIFNRRKAENGDNEFDKKGVINTLEGN